MFIPYNSRFEYHKSKFGAVKKNEEIVFRIILPRNFRVTAAYLVINHDAAPSPQCVSMQWDCMQGADEEWWRVSFVADRSGLFFYHFEYDTPFGRSVILHQKDGYGAMNCGGKDWQLTVFDNNFTTPSKFKGGIIYQIFPDRFAYSGEKKENVPSDRIIRSDWGGEPCWKPDENGITRNNDFFGGDLKGIEQKLDYLKDLSVSCIYLNPIFFAQSNHRYDTADYLKIDPLLGNEDDFCSLCKEAKKRGISVILDGVFSHTGAESVYFNKSGYFDSVGAYQSQNSPYYSWYKFNKFNDDYVCWWGIKILPEVNEDNEDFLDFITGENGVARKWLRLGADGWRLDVADELPDVFLERFRKAVKSEKNDAIIIGEVWEDASNKMSYGRRRKYLSGDELDSVMNYPFANAIIRFVRTGIAEGFRESIMSIIENYPKEVIDVLMNHIGSHDTVRIINSLAGESSEHRDRAWQSGRKLNDEDYHKGIRLVSLAAALQYMLPGIPSVFYGDEIGMQGYNDPFNRGCFVFENADKELLDNYRLLGKIRKENDCFADGRFEFMSCERKCVAFARYGKNDRIMIIANRNEEDIKYYLHEEWHNSEILNGSGICSDFVNVEKSGFVILKNTINKNV